MSTLLSVLTFAAGAPGSPKDAALPAQLSSTGFADTLSRALPGSAGGETDEDGEEDGSESEHAPHADLSARADWSRQWSGTPPEPDGPTPEQPPAHGLGDADAETEAAAPATGASGALEGLLNHGTAESADDHVPDTADASEDRDAEEQNSEAGSNTEVENTERPGSPRVRSEQEGSPQEAAQLEAPHLEADRPASDTPVPPEVPTVSMPAPAPVVSVGAMPAHRPLEIAGSVHLTASTAIQAAPVQSPPVQVSPVQAAQAPQAPAALTAGHFIPTAQPLNAQLAAPIHHLLSSGEGTRTLTLNVAPEQVGPVTVRASFTAEGVRIELFAPQDTGREALRAMLTDLRRDLAGLGMSTGSSSLSVSDGQPPAHHPQQGQQGRGLEQQPGPPDRHERPENQKPAEHDAEGRLQGELPQLSDQPSRPAGQGLDIFA